MYGFFVYTPCTHECVYCVARLCLNVRSMHVKVKPIYSRLYFQTQLILDIQQNARLNKETTNKICEVTSSWWNEKRQDFVQMNWRCYQTIFNQISMILNGDFI